MKKKNDISIVKFYIKLISLYIYIYFMNWQKMMYKYAKKPNSIEIDKQKRKCEWLKI